MSLVITEMASDVGTIILNNERKRNALSEALVGDMLSAFDVLEQARARVVVLRAPRGATVWSAGHDVHELPRGGRDPLGHADPLRTVIRRIEDFKAPVIALVEGTVWGGACELAFSCDLVIATPEVTFAITPAKLSVPYNVAGLLTFMNRMPLPVFKEMAFTGDPVSAARALSLGMLNHVAPKEDIEAHVAGLAHRIAKNAPLSVTAMKKSIEMLAAASALPPVVFEQIQGERRKVWDSKDYQEGIAAFLARREPNYTGE
jgi:methylmalonyl-CoA decarboxylase